MSYTVFIWKFSTRRQHHTCRADISICFPTCRAVFLQLTKSSTGNGYHLLLTFHNDSDIIPDNSRSICRYSSGTIWCKHHNCRLIYIRRHHYHSITSLRSDGGRTTATSTHTGIGVINVLICDFGLYLGWRYYVKLFKERHMLPRRGHMILSIYIYIYIYIMTSYQGYHGKITLYTSDI